MTIADGVLKLRVLIISINKKSRFNNKENDCMKKRVKKNEEAADLAEEEISLTEVAEELGTSRPTAKRHLESAGHLPVGFGPRGVLVFDRESVENWLDQQDADEDEEGEEELEEEEDEEDEEDETDE